MRDVPREDLLTVIGCEIDKRPDAPTIADLAPLVTGMTRTGDGLTVTCAGGSLQQIEAFAAAERQCCGAIGWAVAGTPSVTLTISAPAPTLDLLEQTIRSALIDAHQ